MVIYYDSRLVKLHGRKTAAQLPIEERQRSPASTPAHEKGGELSGDPAR